MTVLKNSVSMMGKSFALSLMLALPLTGSASAQVTVDIGKITCNQFALYKVSDPETIAVWLHGYYSGKRGNMVVDTEKLKTQAKRLRDYCLQNPDTNLLQAVEKLTKQ